MKGLCGCRWQVLSCSPCPYEEGTEIRNAGHDAHSARLGCSPCPYEEGTEILHAGHGTPLAPKLQSVSL